MANKKGSATSAAEKCKFVEMDFWMEFRVKLSGSNRFQYSLPAVTPFFRRDQTSVQNLTH